ncbi:hypothetical protein PRIPAC_92431, partial [Pristionchus pacificus]|uniref:Uncharacterized protein n=1 Tax=Pristionchus pacificus TaxID=54126 RepID=A0A2A6BAK1_PRIPA
GYNVNISFVDSEFANTPLEFSSSEVNIPKIMGCYNHAYAVVNDYLVTVSSGVVIVEKAPTEWSISGEDVTTEFGDDTRGDIRVLTVDIKYVIKRNATFTVVMVLLISLLPSIGALYAEALYSEKFSSMLANASIITFGVGIFLLIETVLVFVHPFCQLLAEMFLKKWEAWNELKVLNGLFVGLIDDVFGGGDDLFRGERRREDTSAEDEWKEDKERGRWMERGAEE